MEGTEGVLAGGILAFVAGFWIFFVVIGLALFVLWIMMFVHALKMDEETFRQLNSGERNIWLAILGVSFFLGFNTIAAIVYYFVIYRKAKSLPEAG